MPYNRAKAEDKATGNAYASILKAKFVDTPKISLVIRNSSTKVADYKILVSNDPAGADVNFAEEKAEAQLAANNATAKYVIGNTAPVPYEWIDVQAKSNSAGNPATLSVYAYAVRP